MDTSVSLRALNTFGIDGTATALVEVHSEGELLAALHRPDLPRPFRAKPDAFASSSCADRVIH